ncbi:MAG: ABC transporter permease [Candidatus Sumerlaeaceae bacterium]|nr:ABC transporter permease [Candidatus Sumerlaeaceae bacterium]
MLGGLLRFGWSSFWQKKLWVTLVTVVMMPVVIIVAGFLVHSGASGNASSAGIDFYRQWWGIFLTFLLPILCVTAGVGLLRDEVESKALIYVWTRPCGRIKPFCAKWVVAAGLVTVCAAIAQAVFYLGATLVLDPNKELTENVNVMVWDGLAVVFCVTGYMTLGLAFATLGKRANQYAVFYVLVVDSLTVLLPGELRKISLKVLITSLSASGAVRETGHISSVFDLINSRSEPLVESEALMAWALFLVLCWIFIAVMFRTKEIGVERVVGQT